MKNNLSDTNGYKIILDTYNKKESPIIEDKVNALVFPWDMKRNVDYIDPAKFYNGNTPK